MTGTPARRQDDPMPAARVREILARIEGARIAVCGDFCLDAYWMLDPRGSEVSVETGLRAQAVARQAYTLGGAANVVANLAALRPAALRAIGIVGDDLFGRDMLRQLQALGVDTAGMIVQRGAFDTVVYGKRYLSDREEPRIDFGFFNARAPDTDNDVLAHVRRALAECDAVVFNQQIPGGLSPAFIEGVNALADEFPRAALLCDARHDGARFPRVLRKTNDAEAARLAGTPIDDRIHPALRDLEAFASDVFARSGRPVFVTRGPLGLLTADADGLHVTPGLQVLERIDPVGAGDTVTSALAACLAAPIAPAEAAAFANLAASVTVRKLFQTGTASPEEVLAASAYPEYIYQPELAHDTRHAAYLPETDIEICGRPLPDLRGVRHVVFDHDGTISTLRQGWEQVMEPTMVRAILGDHYASADATLYQRVSHRVRDYIDKSTGIETIVQMGALAEMVREFGAVPPGERLDAAGYKALYLTALMDVVEARLARLRRGELSVDDLTMKGAVAFLRALRSRGIHLYLASGTDDADVRREAEALGYADVFDGGIYGAQDAASTHAKRRVIDRLVATHGLDGSCLAVVGDGPVELREARRRGGVAVGIASDEVRRYGLNPGKRARLIEAGADLLLPDFSQSRHLLALMDGHHD